MPFDIMELRENERIDYVNDALSLIQNTEGLTFGTDALLLSGYIGSGYKTGAELGGGTGIISMLLLTRKKLDSTVCLEIQPEYAELIERNAEYNRLSDKLACVCADVREYAPDKECELVYTNPPYMRADSGYANRISKKNIARHEVHGSIEDFCTAARGMLKFGGTFAAVYRPDRLTDLLVAMRAAGIEPKRMTLVYADRESVPSMLLVEGKRGGKSGMRMTRPLIIYADASHNEYGGDMKYIMENGVFPADFYVK